MRDRRPGAGGRQASPRTALTRFGAVQQRSAAVTDVFARDGGEYLALRTGETLRLDQLLAVDGVLLAGD